MKVSDHRKHKVCHLGLWWLHQQVHAVRAQSFDEHCRLVQTSLPSDLLEWQVPQAWLVMERCPIQVSVQMKLAAAPVRHLEGLAGADLSGYCSRSSCSRALMFASQWCWSDLSPY